MGKGSASRLTKRKASIISRQSVPGGCLGTHRKRAKSRMPRADQKVLINFENMVLNSREKDGYE